MRILIISNMYPSKQKPYSGIFVKNQYEALRNMFGEESVEIKYMKRTFTKGFRSVLKYIRFILYLLPSYFKRYDIIHFHYFYLSIVFLPYKIIYPKSKFIVTFHGQDIIRLRTSKMLLSFFRFLAKKIDDFIPVGQEVKNIMEQKLNVKGNYILPVGVDNTVFFDNPNVETKYDFIYVGSFYNVKGIDIIIKTIQLLKNNGQNISFCFVGSGEYYNELFKLKEDGFNVDILGAKTHKELADLYNSSRFLLTHSRSEGFPTSTLEAMYCGIPVLASDIPQFSEQITHNENGWLVELGNINDLSDKILELNNLSEDSYLLYSEFAKESNKKYTLENVIKKLINIYKND
jgi:L-malate glycosyltransferase